VILILKIGEHYLNMAHLVHAHFTPDGRVKLVFNAPMPASVGASDWATGAYTVSFKDRDVEAIRAFLERRELPKGGES
jgi:hypothetical protein